MCYLAKKNFHLGKAARRRCVHRRNHLRHVRLDECPAALPEHDNGNLAARQILLIAEVLVGRHEHVKACGFSLVKQFSIRQFISSTGARFRHRVVVDQIAGKSARGTVVKENQHLLARNVCLRAVRSELQNCFNLLPSDAEFVHELVNAHILKVLEHR